MDQQTDIYTRAAIELKQVDDQIASLVERRNALRQFVDLGRKLFTDQGPKSSISLAALEDRARSDEQASVAGFAERMRYREEAREGSMKARVLEMSRSFIQRLGPLPTVKLVELIEAGGQPITGKDKNVTVSVILSRSDEFVSDRTRGWSLSAEKTPEDAATSPGSSAA